MEVIYAFTVKDNRKRFPSVGDYEDWCAKAQAKGFNVDCMYYELDAGDRLHIHGVARGRSKFFVNSIRPTGWHVQLVQLDDDRGARRWSDYIQKHWVSEDANQQMLYAYMVRHGHVYFQEA